MPAYKVIHSIDGTDTEHVFIVVAQNAFEARVAVAERNGWDGHLAHPWAPRYGNWAVSELTEDHGPLKLYSINRATGEMIL